ncbi:MAG: hypothetical protein ACLFPI_07840 [Desulfobacterales bacterium]
MKSYIDYGAWINDKHYSMTRQQWLSAMRIVFPGTNIDELKTQITQARRRACSFDGYLPGLFKYASNRVAAYYHVSGNCKWHYVQGYGPEIAVCIAACLYVRDILSQDPKDVIPEIAKFVTDEHLKKPEQWGLWPGLERMNPHFGRHIITDLKRINYHDESAIFADALFAAGYYQAA